MTDRTRDVFVIMPFTSTPTRDKGDLNAFFEHNLKRAIETHDGFKYNYRVLRSDDSFDIGKQIVRDIYNADIVLCDLSGEHANPNVMYELGLRLALTNKPVIIFREKHSSNKSIFDVSLYHCKDYLPTQYRDLETYILGKITKFETGAEDYMSPVLEILQKEPSIVREIELRKIRNLLTSINSTLAGLLQGAGGALHYFLEQSKATVLPPPNSEELINFIHKHKEILGTFEWGRFAFHPNLPPPLHEYLCTNPLHGLIEPWLSKLWNAAFTEYYKRFFGTSLHWDFMSLKSFENFVGETTLLRTMIHFLLLYLFGDNLFGDKLDQSKSDVREHMLKGFEHFLGWKKQGFIDHLRKEI